MTAYLGEPNQQIKLFILERYSAVSQLKTYVRYVDESGYIPTELSVSGELYSTSIPHIESAKEIYIGDMITSVSQLTGCPSLTAIAIPGSVQSIAANAFSECAGLSADNSIVFVEKSVEALSTMNNYPFGKSGHTNVFATWNVATKEWVQEQDFGHGSSESDQYVLSSRSIAGYALSADISADQLSTAIGLANYAAKNWLTNDVNGILTGYSTTDHEHANYVSSTTSVAGHQLTSNITVQQLSDAIGLSNYSAASHNHTNYVLTSTTVVGKELSGSIDASDISSAIGLSNYSLTSHVHDYVSNAISVAGHQLTSNVTATDISTAIGLSDYSLVGHTHDDLKPLPQPFDFKLSSNGSYYIDCGKVMFNNEEYYIDQPYFIQSNDSACYIDFVKINDEGQISWSAQLSNAASTASVDFSIKIYDLYNDGDTIIVGNDFRGINLPANNLSGGGESEVEYNAKFFVNGVDAASFAGSENVNLEADTIAGENGISVRTDSNNNTLYVSLDQEVLDALEQITPSDDSTTTGYTSDGAIPFLADVKWLSTTHQLVARYAHVTISCGLITNVQYDDDNDYTTIFTAVEENSGSQLVASAVGSLRYSDAADVPVYSSTNDDLTYTVLPDVKDQHISFSLFPLTSDCNSCGQTHANALNVHTNWNGGSTYNTQVGDFTLDITPQSVTDGNASLVVELAARDVCSQHAYSAPLSCGATVTIDGASKVIGPHECPLGTADGLGSNPLSILISISDGQLQSANFIDPSSNN